MNPAGQAVALGLLAALVAADVRAGSSRAGLNVSATVLPVAHVQWADRPAFLDISAVDARRGYIEVPEPQDMLVSSNSPSGVLLSVAPLPAPIRAVVLIGLGPDLELQAGGGEVVQRWAHAGSETLRLRMRFLLSPACQAGRYEWPLRLTAIPLSD